MQSENGFIGTVFLILLLLQILNTNLFTLFCLQERQEILRIHVNKWDNKPDPSIISKLAEQSSGYCGSDLRALCAESVIQALRRTYPQIYKSNQRLLLDANKVQVLL